MQAPTAAEIWWRPAEMRYRYLLGVKWSQVQILSARPNKTRSDQHRSGFFIASLRRYRRQRGAGSQGGTGGTVIGGTGTTGNPGSLGSPGIVGVGAPRVCCWAPTGSTG